MCLFQHLLCEIVVSETDQSGCPLGADVSWVLAAQDSSWELTIQGGAAPSLPSSCLQKRLLELGRL